MWYLGWYWGWGLKKDISQKTNKQTCEISTNCGVELIVAWQYWFLTCDKCNTVL